MIQADPNNPHDMNWLIISEQMERFGGLDKYPSPRFEPAAFKELCIAAKIADDTMHLASIVGGILQVAQRCPTPAELRSEINPPDRAKIWKGNYEKLPDHPSETVRQRRERLLKSQEAALTTRILELKNNPSLPKTKPTAAKNLLAQKTLEMDSQW